MQKRVTKVLSVLLAAMLVVGMVGCGSEGKQESSDETTKESVSAESKETESKEEAIEEVAKWTNDYSEELTILIAGDTIPNEDNLVLKKLEEETGLKLNIQHISGSDYDTKINALISAGDTPDLWKVGLQRAEELKEAGIIADMTDVLNAVAPNVINETKDVINQPSVNKDGIYMVMNMFRGYSTNVNIRTDWLDNLGLEMPTDLDSYAKVLHAFTYDDPDQNGVDDTFGLSFTMGEFQGANQAFSNVFGAYGIAKGRPMMIDGTVTTWVKHPKFLEAMKYIKGLIDDGVCEPDYLTIPTLSSFERLWNGQSGVMEFQCVGPTNNWWPGRYTEDPAPTFDFAILKGPDGEHGTAANYYDTTSGWVFSAESKNLEGLAKLANYLMTEEASVLTFLGIEGEMFNWIDKENGSYEYIGENTDSATQRQNGGFVYNSLFMPTKHAEVSTLNALTQRGLQLAYDNEIEWVNVSETTETEKKLWC